MGSLEINQLEYLPNELLIEVFKNLNVQCLFRAFYGLNARFDTLLQSLHHCLTVRIPDSKKSPDDELFYPYVHTLIIQDGVDLTFDHLPNVRRVVLYYTARYPIRDLQVDIGSHLEHFSVLSSHSWLMCFSPDFIQKIFSNAFPHLKSCCLSLRAVILAKEGWTQSPSLRILNTGYIRANAYATVLSSCPNLHSLHFVKWPKEQSTISIQTHPNLKRMVVHLPLDDFVDTHHVKEYFLAVPNLEQLTIHVSVRELANIRSLTDCDWFASIIDDYLPRLRRFHCYVDFHSSAYMEESEHDAIATRLKEKFERKHSDRYQSKVVCRFSSS